MDHLKVVPMGTLERATTLLAIIVLHAALMAVGLLFIEAKEANHWDSRFVRGVELSAVSAPALIAGVAFRWRFRSSPTSGVTWLLAFAFSASSFAIAIYLGAEDALASVLPGLFPMQWWGLVTAIAALSVLASALLFWGGTRMKGRKQPKTDVSS